MTKITFVATDGSEQTIDARAGESVMEAAVRNDIAGIDADCGGACACATCHVYIDAAFEQTVGKAEDLEQSMLEFTDQKQPNSRLCCQIEVVETMDGLSVITPNN